MNISYITTYNALDIHQWSGIGYHLAKTLENQDIGVDYIGNLSTKPSNYMRIKQKLYYKLTNKRFNTFREPYIAKLVAQQIKLRMNQSTDIIFSPATLPISLLETKKPKVIYTDSTFASMVNFYDDYSHFCLESIKKGNYLEQQALDSSDLIIYSSDWAAKTAIDIYKINPNKIKIVPFGANFKCDNSRKDIFTFIAQRTKNICNLLFIGVEWERKGGAKAIEIAKQLNNLGLKTRLDIVGINNLPIDNLPEFVDNHGFISKTTSEGINKIKQLFKKSHFLILPTIADCSPIVFPEANSFGLPCITTNVGGITSIIKDDINGKTFSVNSDTLDWCNFILSTFEDKKKYTELCLSSYEEYEKNLNWEIAGKRIVNLLKSL